jgi:hypothetical protein
MRKTGQRVCVYCGVDFTASYESWLTMALDHVVPSSVCNLLGLPAHWREDCINKVLACAACNGFRNRYQPIGVVLCPTSLEEFCRLRDEIFSERKALIATSHESDRRFFEARPWEQQLAGRRKKKAPLTQG